MLEQNFAEIFRDFAKKIAGDRAALEDMGLEANELIEKLDALEAALLEQAERFER